MAPAPSMSPPIRVQLFARYAELLGAPQIDMPSEGIRTVEDVIARLRQLPGGAAIGSSTLVAINLRQARSDSPVSPRDEIAILPPLAGG